MGQINLKSDNVISQQDASSGSSTSLVMGVIILFLSVAAYGGLYYYTETIKQKIEDVQAEKQQQQALLEEQKWKDLYSFEDRLVELKTKLAARSSQAENIEKISVVTLPETVFQSLHISKEDGASTDTVEAEVLVPNFDTLSKQLKAFSLISNVSEISPNSVERAETGTDLKVVLKFEIGLASAAEEKTETTPSTSSEETL